MNHCGAATMPAGAPRGNWAGARPSFSARVLRSQWRRPSWGFGLPPGKYGFGPLRGVGCSNGASAAAGGTAAAAAAAAAAARAAAPAGMGGGAAAGGSVAAALPDEDVARLWVERTWWSSR